MITNKEALADLFKGFQLIFRQTLEAAPDLFAAIGTQVPGSGSSTDLPLVGLTGGVREWVGDRQVQNLAAYLKNVEHKDWEQTVSVKKNDISDDLVGIYRPEIENMAVLAKRWPYELAITRLMTDGFSVEGLDEQALFSASHTWAGAYTTAQDNLTDETLDATAVTTGIQAMRGFKGPDGKALRSYPTHFLCDPSNESTARGLFMNQNDAAGASNTLFGTFKEENILIDPDVPSGAWAMLDCSKPVKPAVAIMREWPPEFTSLTDETDENVFMRKEYLYGTNFRLEVVAYHWWLVYGSDGSE